MVTSATTAGRCLRGDRMARIGLIDVDGRRFPNLALMRISAYHKNRGDTVEWWWSDFEHYDRVYMSKIFSEAYSPDIPEPLNVDEVIKGGTGYCISLGADGKERFDKGMNVSLPAEVEKCFPDYSIYPQYEYAVGFTSRGCPRGCPFCIVAPKEGRKSMKVADVRDFWNGQSVIKVLDPNITACADKRELMKQYLETGAIIDFTQGLDIRLIDDEDIRDLNSMRLTGVHFAWDNAKEDLRPRFEYYAKYGKNNRHGHLGVVYVLTNYNSTMEENLYRIYTLCELGYHPYVMVYNKPSAPQELRDLQRWCNTFMIIRACPKFEDYDPRNFGKVEDETSENLF